MKVTCGESWSTAGVFDFIEMILTIFMNVLPHYARLFLSNTLCIVTLAPKEHFHNHDIFFRRQGWIPGVVHLFWIELRSASL